MGRLRQLDPRELTEAQRALYDRIAAKRGAVRGPFNAWLYSPELCDRVESLGKYLRYDSAIPMLLREVVVLVVARHFTAQYMWQAHAKIAVNEGVLPAVVEAIGRREPPPFPSPDQKVVFDYAVELLRDHQISDETWAATVALLGEVGTIELTAFIGNFAMVAMALNAFKVDLPKGVEPQLT